MKTETKSEATVPRHGMSPQEQRVAIAEACPNLFEIHETYRGRGSDRYIEKFLTRQGEGITGEEIDPLNDLNAMQSAVLSQDDDFITRFALEMNKAENRMHKHQWAMSAQDYADCFISVLKSQRDSLKVNA